MKDLKILKSLSPRSLKVSCLPGLALDDLSDKHRSLQPPRPYHMQQERAQKPLDPTGNSSVMKYLKAIPIVSKDTTKKHDNAPILSPVKYPLTFNLRDVLVF